MAYQVIARKWRPQTFEEVTGQEPITRTLRGAIEHERLHHAYLFSGARGVGKTTTARLLAKALNCHKSDKPMPTPCKITDPDACPSCREIAEGRSIDVLEIDAASNTGVDNVREAIINTVAVRPARDRFKVFIIDEVHMLSGAAFNALLKTLEEPPPRIVFIMATTESHKVPDTILSRCQQFEFRTIATLKIAERLRLIADAEQIKIDDAALYEIARAGDGSMRDAQSAFDQVISFSEGKITSADVEAALGLASAEQLARVVAAVANEQPAEALAVVDDLVMRGHDLRNFCRDLLAHLRDLLVAKVGGADEAQEAAQRKSAAAAFSESDLVRFFHSLTETEQKLREGAHPRYQLEVGLIKLIEMRRLAPLSQIIERLGALEEALRTGRAPLAGSAGSVTSSGGTGGAPPRSGASGASGGGRSTPPGASRTSTSRASVSATSQTSPTPTPAAAPPTAAYAAPGTSEPARVKDPLDWSSHTVGASAVDAPFWETLPAATADTAPQSAAVPAPTNAASSSAPLRLVNKPAAPATGGAGKSFAARGWRVPGRDADLPPEPPEFSNSGGGARADSITEQIKRALEERRKHLLATALDGARRASVEGDEFYIEFAPEQKHLRDTLNKPDAMKLLREVCRELLGRDVGVRVMVKDARATDAPPTREDEELRERQQLRELAESNPAVQHLLRTFRAEIIDVRRVEPEQGGGS
ncbi:MAG: DNA polymerase III subunit gamma/tau [Pyrinomonadaceae bacterium]